MPALAAYDASQVIPGVGLPVTARHVVLPDSRDVDTHLYGVTNKGKWLSNFSNTDFKFGCLFSTPFSFKKKYRVLLYIITA